MYELDSKTWKQVSEYWWQKIIVNKTGKVFFTYHYKFKSASPAIIFEIDTKIAHQICGYILIEKDIRDTLAFLDAHHLAFEAENSKNNDILLKALARAIAVTYGKCFVEASGRKIRLDANKIPKMYLDTHDELMEMRHHYVAHAGKSKHESCKYLLLLPPQTKLKSSNSINLQESFELRQVITTSDIIVNAKPLLDYLHENVKAKLASFVEVKTSSDSYPFFRYGFYCRLKLRFSTFSCQIFLPSINVSIGVRPQHIFP